MLRRQCGDLDECLEASHLIIWTTDSSHFPAGYLYTVPFLPTIVFPVHILQKKLSWIQNLDVVSIEFGNVYKDLIHCWIISERKVFSNN